MTIAAGADARLSYAGNGVTTAFTTPQFLADADIVCLLVDDTTGVPTTQVLNTDFTLTGAGAASGTLTMLVAPPTGTTLVIYTDPAVSQDVDLVNGDTLDVDVEIEAPLDKLTLLQIRTRDLVDRSLRLPEGDSGFVAADLELPPKVTRASNYLAFDANGKPIASAGTTNATPISAFMATVVDDIDAATARTTLGAAALASAVMDGDAAGGALSGTYPSPTLAAGVGFTTGDVKLSMKTAADAGWVLMNDTSIGDASSGATGRANADTLALFTLLWTNAADTDCPVSSGRGASAAADFAAHKTLALPRALGRALANYGAGSTVEAVTASSGNGFVVASNNTRWITGMPVVLSNLTGFTTSATAGPTYYVVRISSTNIRFATTLALAQTGSPDVTISGTGTCTITYNFTSRALGAWTGEEAHAMSSTELLSHTHTPAAHGAASNLVSPNEGNANCTGSTAPGFVLNNTGGNAAMNVMQPTLFLSVMIKL